MVSEIMVAFEVAWRVVEEHGGELPCRDEVLVAFQGVGAKQPIPERTCDHVAIN
jgi:hypothetical protein